jgi:hypothetical protein
VVACESYTSVIALLQRIPLLPCPSDKLKCVQQACREISACIVKYHLKRGCPIPPHKAQVAADDLLPIISFVLVQASTRPLVTASPEVVAQQVASIQQVLLQASDSDPTKAPSTEDCWLHEHVAVMEEFILPHVMAGEQGYCLVTLQTALQHLSMLSIADIRDGSADGE